MGNTGTSSSPEDDSGEATDAGLEKHAPVIDDSVPVVALIDTLNTVSPSPAIGVLSKWIIVIGGLVSILVGFALGATVFLYRGPNAYVQFAKPEQLIPDVCAESEVRQDNEMTIQGPAQISLVATLYSDADGAIYLPLTESYFIAVDKNRTTRSPFTWRAPKLPPSRYTRIVGATVGNVTATAITHFALVDCDAAGVPIPLTPP